MEVCNKAPAGGLVSKVNGQFYQGGEFMPVNGLFCGKSGAKRSEKWAKFAAKGKAVDCGGSAMYEVTTYAGGGVWNILGVAIASSEKEAAAAFKSATKTYAKKI